MSDAVKLDKTYRAAKTAGATTDDVTRAQACC